MGLLLSDDVYYAETAEGMTILSPAGPVALIGRTPYPMLRALHPLLDGTYTLDELVAGLPEDRAAAVRRLITMLSDTGVVRSTAADGDIGVGGNALVIGKADFCTEMERTVRRSGGSVTRIATDGSAEVTDAVRTALADIDFGYCWLPSLDPASVESIETAFRLRGVPLAWVSSVGENIWFACGAPTGEDTPLSALSVLLRLDANGHVTEQDRVELAAPAGTALAVRLERSRSSPRREAVRFDPDTLESSVVKTTTDHPFAAPAATCSADEFGARIVELARSPRLTEAEFSARAAGFRGEWTGLFTDPDESDFAQIPLRVCRATVSDPVGLLRLRGEPRPEVVGWGGDFAFARYRAVEQALATYASIMVDPARLQTNSVRDSDAAGRAATLRALLTGAVRGHTHAYRLDDAAVLMVDATTAFPVLAAATPYRLPPGVAFGYSWDDAVCRGILGQCREIALRGLRTGESVATRVRPPRGSATESATLARLFGAELELWQVRSVPAVPAAACTIGGRLVSCTSGLTFDDAATAALETALLRCQSMAEQRPEYAPRVPEDIVVGGIAAEVHEAEPMDLAVLTSMWARAGRRPVVVPLDHDPRLSAALPYLVHVVWAGECG
ncbi:hypothetical protein [Nocardia pseudobrasiliensis]|uniref:YcaO domain-containing protein n=1 Tax=Nocardia pseudobrasiliensis TaxID=45979 RepID=A0A370I6U6_9NOCA|nr:hypothetical protein [Nocardia pseudobrasiliensis]RDI66466.1 hypothetical protein DFR76_104212 [Nocardia pseudobrasiliensis]